MSTAGKSYEAWKESLMQADAAGDEGWSEEWSGASGPRLADCLGALGGKELGAALLIGVGLLIASAGILLLNVKYFAHGERTVGVIVDHRDYHKRQSSTLRAPVVRYSAPGGIYDVEGSLSVPRRIYPVDKEVSVLYLPNNPSNAVIFDFVQLFMIPTFVGGLGLVCLTGAGGLMFWTVRRELPGESTAPWPSLQLLPSDQQSAKVEAPPAPSPPPT